LSARQLASYSSNTVATKNVRIFITDDGWDAEVTGSTWLEPKTLIYAKGKSSSREELKKTFFIFEPFEEKKLVHIGLNLAGTNIAEFFYLRQLSIGICLSIRCQ
jgi:hypothetical protein